MKTKTLQNIVKEPVVAYNATETPLDLVTLTRNGIPKQALLNLGNLLDLTADEIAKLMPVTKRTLQRKSPNTSLNTAVSEQIVLIASLTDKGEEVFGSLELFKKWLKTENTSLGGNKPLDLLDTAIGIQLVEDVLGRIAYGVYS